MDKVKIDRELKAVISGKLKQIRKDSDHSIEKMAAEIGLEYTSFYNIYNGRNLPRLLTLIQISQTYNIPIDFWFKSIADLNPVKKKEIAVKNAVDPDVLRVFNKIDKETGEAILRVLKGYVRKPRYEVR